MTCVRSVVLSRYPAFFHQSMHNTQKVFLTFPTNGNPTLSSFIFHICIWSQLVPVLKVFHFDHKASLLLCKHKRLMIPITLYFVILTTQGTWYYVSFSFCFSVRCLLPYYLKSIFVNYKFC